jgi:hypothetical protein
MVYVPRQWIKHETNIGKVFKVLEKLDIDVRFNGSFTEKEAIKELEKIDEPIIIQKLKEGKFCFGS